MMPPNSSFKILFITLSNLGDVVLTTPVLAALRGRFPAAGISVFVGTRPSTLFEGHPWITRTYVYEKTASLFDKWKLMGALRKERFDLVVDLRHSLIPFLTGAKRANPLLFRAKKAERMSALAEHLSVLDELDFGRAPGEPFPFYDAVTLDSVEKKLACAGIQQGAPYVALAAGARSHLKRWPVERFREVASQLHRLYGVSVVFVGDEAEKDICREASMGLDGWATDLSGRTTVRELAAVLDRSVLVVTNDSAALHLADQQNRPVVAIFGPTNDRRYGPAGKSSKVVRRHLFCAPCEKAQCPFSHECMQNLDLGDVLEACRPALEALEVRSC